MTRNSGVKHVIPEYHGIGNMWFAFLQKSVSEGQFKYFS